MKLDGEDVSEETTLTVDEIDQLQVEIDLRDIADLVCERPRPLYLRATAVVSAAGDGFVGRVDSTCNSRTGLKPFLWTGSVSHPSHAAGMQRMIALLAPLPRRGRS